MQPTAAVRASSCVTFDSVPLELPGQRLPFDAENECRLRLIPGGRLQHGEDVAAFRFVEWDEHVRRFVGGGGRQTESLSYNPSMGGDCVRVDDTLRAWIRAPLSMMARRTTCSSSRTFPGQACAASASSTACVGPAIDSRRISFATFCLKCSTSRGMSDCRLRSGGTAISYPASR